MTIVEDRYGGCYSGGAWLAFNLEPQNIPEEIGNDDATERNFWDTYEARNPWVGKGSSPNEAMEALIRKNQQSTGEAKL